MRLTPGLRSASLEYRSCVPETIVFVNEAHISRGNISSFPSGLSAGRGAHMIYLLGDVW